jgi:hypothetical protein
VAHYLHHHHYKKKMITHELLVHDHKTSPSLISYYYHYKIPGYLASLNPTQYHPQKLHYESYSNYFS